MARRCVSVLTAALFSALFSGCSTGGPEFGLYDEAFDAQIVQGELVLDRVARAERIVQARQPQVQSLSTFDPDNAVYYVEVGDPPFTASIRASLDAVQTYNKVLIGLANGEAAASLSSRVGGITSNLAIVVAALPGATGVAAGGASTTVLSGLAVAEQMLPAFDSLSAAVFRAEFRRQLLLAYPDMRKLLMTVREGTTLMYAVLRRSSISLGQLGVGVGGISTDAQMQLVQDRQLLAGWVILIDQTLIAMEQAVDAALNSASVANSSELLETSTELRVLVERLRDLRAAQ